MSMTYAELEELFDELVKRTEESRRKDQINYDVSDIRDILYKIHDNTSNVEDEGKKQIDTLTDDLKENQKLREERQNRSENPPQRTPSVRRRREYEESPKEIGISIAKAIDNFTHLTDIGYQHIDKRLQTWQSLYSSGGAWNGNFLQISSDINKAGMTLEEFTKNFAESGFGGHLFGADNFLKLSGSVRQAARDLGDIGIPASEYNKALSLFTDNLRENNDLAGHSIDELTKKFTDLIEEAGSLTSSFGLTVEEFLKARNSFADNNKFRLTTDTLSNDEKEKLESGAAIFAKIFSQDQIAGMISYKQTGNTYTDNTARQDALAMGQANYDRLATDFYNIKNAKNEDDFRKYTRQIVEDTNKGYEYYHNTFGKTGISPILATGKANGDLATGAARIVSSHFNLPSLENLDNSKNNRPDNLTKLGVETQQGAEQNKAKEENISSSILNNSQDVVNSLLNIRKLGQDKYGATLDAVAVKTANYAGSMDKTLSTMLDVSKNQLSDLAAIKHWMGFIAGGGALAFLLKFLKLTKGFGFGESSGRGTGFGLGGAASRLNSSSILNGGTGGYHFGNTGSSFRPNEPIIRNAPSGNSMGGYSVSGTIRSDESILRNASQDSRLTRGISKLRGLGSAFAIGDIGLNLLEIANDKNKEEEEKQKNPNDSDQITSEHRRNRNNIIGETVGNVGGGFGGAWAAVKAADHVAKFMPNKAARVGLDLIAGTAGGILGGSAVSNITTMMSDKISDIEDKISGKPIDKNNPNDVRREKNQRFFSKLLNPISDAINYGTTGAAIGGIAGTAGLGVGAIPGSLGGGIIGGIGGFAHGIYHDDEDNVVGKGIGNLVSNIEDWWSGTKVETKPKKPDDDSKNQTNNSSDNTMNGPNNNSIISTHYHQKAEEPTNSIDNVFMRLYEMMDRNMKLQNELLNKINNSTKDNTTAVKNQSSTI